MTINESNTMIQTGNALNKEFYGYQFISQLSATFTLRTAGSITFKYKKDTITKGDNTTNGHFDFDINYQNKINDTEINSNWIEKKIPLEKGTYSFLWKYSKEVNSKNELGLMMKIEFIYINGIETSAVECISCHNGVAHSGSDHCDLCRKNQYFDISKVICADCPLNQISPANSIGINSCVNKSICQFKDYIALPDNSCDLKENLTIGKYYLYNNQCKEISSTPSSFLEKKMKCSQCPIGKYWIKEDNQSYSTCQDCPINTYSKEINRIICLPCINGIIIKTTTFYPQKINSIEIKNITIIGIIGEMNIDFTIINPKEPSFFNVIIDKTNLRIDSKMLIPFILNKGNHNIQIKGKNAAIIQVHISNTKDGSGYDCIDCANELLLNDIEKSYCVLCNKGYEYDTSTKQCKECKDNYYKSIESNKEQCQRCPLMTIPNKLKTHCVPLDFITHKGHMQKYNLKNIREVQSQLCTMTNICINNFLGPLKDTNNHLYFISFDSPNNIPIQNLPFAVNNNTTQLTPGFIFSFEKKDNSSIRNAYNLGSQLKSIKLIKGANVRGLLFNYAQGDNCLEDLEHKYQSFLFLNCSKYNNKTNEEFNLHTSPRIIKKDKCKYYFEWSSSAACPLCLSNEVMSVKIPCNSTQSAMISIEGPKCIISKKTTIQNDSSDNRNSIQFIDESLMINDNDDKHILEAFDLHELIKERPIMSSYFDSTGIVKTCNITEEIDEEITVEKKQNWTMIILLAIIGYMTLSCIGVVIWFKYSKLRNSYHKLEEEPSIPMESLPNENQAHTIQSNNPNHQIEMSNQTNKSLSQSDVDQPEIEVKIHHGK